MQIYNNRTERNFSESKEETPLESGYDFNAEKAEQGDFKDDGAGEFSKEHIPKIAKTDFRGGDVVALEQRVGDPPETKSERLKKIEQEMSEGLQDVYFSLSDNDKNLARVFGEKTALEIEAVIEKALVYDPELFAKEAGKQILEKIRKWMSSIPGVNRYFLEQESKIKTDRIIAIVMSSFLEK